PYPGGTSASVRRPVILRPYCSRLPLSCLLAGPVRRPKSVSPGEGVGYGRAPVGRTPRRRSHAPGLGSRRLARVSPLPPPPVAGRRLVGDLAFAGRGSRHPPPHVPRD